MPHRIGDLSILCKFPSVPLIVPRNIDPEEPCSPVLEHLVSLNQNGRLPLAGWSRGVPEVQNHDLPPEVFEFDFFAREKGQTEIGGWFIYHFHKPGR
jgi:hypothetical protein